jgi:hypothetical protein
MFNNELALTMGEFISSKRRYRPSGQYGGLRLNVLCC